VTTALILTKNEGLAQQLGAIFTEVDCEVTVVVSLDEAFERVRQAGFRFVVTEADGDGMNVARRAREEQPEINLISVGTLPDQAERQQAEDLDVWAFPAPLDLPLLRRTVRALLVLDRLRLRVAGLDSAPEDHQVDELWFSIFDQLRGRRSEGNDG
jgi:DNA-binding response OmpR family regulator